MKSVTTITPQRITFVGGGTDFPGYYQIAGGKCLSSAINQYLYVTVKRHGPLFDENYRLNYSSTELCNSIEEIKNNIARECLRLVPVDAPLFISTISDLPSSSGLASSSCFAVGLLHSLHILRGEKVSPGQLAEEACQVEIDMLKSPIGKQDQYAASFGGLNQFSFLPNNRVLLDHLWLANNGIDALFDHILLFWTSIQRDSSTILSQQKSNINDNLEYLDQINSLVDPFIDELLKSHPDFRCVGQILLVGWNLKRSLSATVSNSSIDEALNSSLKLGAFGGKIVGAGGGGFLMLIAPPSKHRNIIEGLSSLQHVPIKYEAVGTRVHSIF